MSRRVVLLSALLASSMLALAGWRVAARWLSARAAVELTMPVSGGGVSIDWAPARGGSAEPRDFLLRSDRLRLVVANDASGMERHQRHGALIALGQGERKKDELIELRSVLYVAGSEAPLRTLGVEVGWALGRPVLKVAEASHDGRFELRTEYCLAAGVSYVEVKSTVTNVSREKVDRVQLGERGRWPGTTAFAPRLGYVHVATRAEVSWLARAGRDVSYGSVFLERPAEASFQFDVVGAVGEVVLGASSELGPGASREFRRDAIAIEGGLGALAEVAWQRLGKPLGHARGVLVPAPSSATVSALHPDGRLVLSVQVAADGAFDLPLPTGEYRFVLASPGGEDEEQGRVSDGAELPLKFVPPRPGTLSYVLADEQGQLLSGRLVLRGVAPTKDPDLMPAKDEAGSGHVLYSLTGAGSLELPPGRYQVLATRGPEFSLPRQEVEVNAGSGATFRGVLSRTVDTRGWLASDFHVHAAPSEDSDVSLKDRVLTLAAEGIELAAATDHNHVTDYAESIAHDHLGDHLASMPGVEITTPGWGHFNAYPWPKTRDVPLTHAASPLEIFAVVRARAPRAVLQVNHPRMPGVGYFNRGELDTKTGVAEAPGFSFGFDALEVSNGFELEDPRVLERNLREWFELLNLGHRYTAVGNSDSHRVLFQWAGWPRTYVRVPDQDPTRVVPGDVARALTAGHALVSCGIFVLPVANGSAGPGDTVQAGRVSLAVSLRAPDWVDVSRVEIYARGVKIWERTRSESFRKLPWNLDVDLDFSSDTWLVVVAQGDQFMNEVLPDKWIKPFGFSNPIYVDADGDGTFAAPASAP